MNHTHDVSRRAVLRAAAAGVAVTGFGLVGRGANAQSGSVGSIVDFAFQPWSVAVAVGGAVTWVNDGSAVHTVTAADGSFDSGLIAPGASVSLVFNSLGVANHHRAIHPMMTGSVSVDGGM